MKSKLLILSAFCVALQLNAAPTITIHADQPDVKINPATWEGMVAC